MSEVGYEPEGRAGRATTLLFTAVIGLAFIGYFVGIDYGVPKPEAAPAIPGALVEDQDSGAVASMSYEQVRQTNLGPTRDWKYTIDQIPQPERDLFAVLTPDPEAKRVSLLIRSERRAYNGAPPVIPHDVDQLSNAACLTCHGAGLQIQDRTARQLPHPYLASCTQCHAPATPTLFAPDESFGTGFVGIAAPFEGERAWVGAPPTIPHSTLMRDNCLACHGPGGWPGMETTHPFQQNCLQCHAPSALLDQGVATDGWQLLPPPVVEDE